MGGHLKGYNYVVPQRAPEDLVAKFQATVTAIDANALKCVRQNAGRRTVFFTEMGPGPLNTYYNCEESTIIHFCSLRYLTVTCNSKTMRRRTDDL